MNAKAKHYKVNIFGDQYVIVSDEPEEHIFQIASKVNDLMESIAEKSGIKDIKRIAVLSALQLADSLNTLEKENQSIDEKQKYLIDLINHSVHQGTSNASNQD